MKNPGQSVHDATTRLLKAAENPRKVREERVSGGVLLYDENGTFLGLIQFQRWEAMKAAARKVVELESVKPT